MSSVLNKKKIYTKQFAKINIQEQQNYQQIVKSNEALTVKKKIEKKSHLVGKQLNLPLMLAPFAVLFSLSIWQVHLKCVKEKLEST